VSSIRIQVSDPARIESLAEELADNPQIDLSIISEEEFFSSQSAGLATIINSFGYAVAIIMGFGAVFAALNTMYAAVISRTVEIGTLRALGLGLIGGLFPAIRAARLPITLALRGE